MSVTNFNNLLLPDPSITCSKPGNPPQFSSLYTVDSEDEPDVRLHAKKTAKFLTHREFSTPPSPAQTEQPPENAATYKTCGCAHKNPRMRQICDAKRSAHPHHPPPTTHPLP
jgi:hypothetical protein